MRSPCFWRATGPMARRSSSTRGPASLSAAGAGQSLWHTPGLALSEAGPAAAAGYRGAVLSRHAGPACAAAAARLQPAPPVRRSRMRRAKPSSRNGAAGARGSAAAAAGRRGRAARKAQGRSLDLMSSFSAMPLPTSPGKVSTTSSPRPRTWPSSARSRGDSGLVRSEVADWPKTIQDTLNGGQKITLAVVMLGANDRQPISEGDASYEPAHRSLAGPLPRPRRCRRCASSGSAPSRSSGSACRR